MLLAMVAAVTRVWRPRFNSATGWALRVTGVAALAIGGVAAGRGVVAVSAERAAPAAHASESGARSAPAFASTIRSWVAPATTTGSAAAGPAAVATAYTVAVAGSRSDVAPSFAAQTDDGARGASLPRIDVPASVVQLVPAATAAAATPPVQVPSATPAPATAQAEPAVPPVSLAAESASPDDAVRSFYALLEQGDFDNATGLWTAHMRGAYPPAENIYGRFARTQALTVRRADVVALDAAAGRATVAVDLTEVVGPPAATRRYVGTWQVVRGPSGWLLDQPNLQPS